MGRYMPLTAKLSRKFYETFGDQIATELVEWFNQVDSAYRSEFRDLFEVHFGRFEAEQRQLGGTFGAKLGQVGDTFGAKLEQVGNTFGAKLEQVEATFGARLEQLAATVDAKLEQFRAEMRAEYATKSEVTALRIRIEALESRLIRWMFIFWIGTLGTLVALLKL
jgi:hypothetical protein